MKAERDAVQQSEKATPPAAAPLQRAAVNETPVTDVPPIVHEVLHSPGQPLDAETRAFFQPRFGHDFSDVRVHTDAKAVESAQAINALAYTLGQNVVFGAGQYSPESREGRRLLAHELTHVVQQIDSHLAGPRMQLQKQDAGTPLRPEVSAPPVVSVPHNLEVEKMTAAQILEHFSHNRKIATIKELITSIENSSRDSREPVSPPRTRAEVTARLTSQQTDKGTEASIAEKIAATRSLIASLTKDELNLTVKESDHVKSSLYQQLNRLAPYFTQHANQNVLRQTIPASERTCGLTSLAMVFEALAVTAQDFVGDNELLSQIALTFSDLDLAEWRLPDILQVALIYVTVNNNPANLASLQGKRNAYTLLRDLPAQGQTSYDARSVYISETAALIDRDRRTAAGKVTALDIYQPLATLFGVRVTTTNFDINSEGKVRGRIVSQLSEKNESRGKALSTLELELELAAQERLASATELTLERGANAPKRPESLAAGPDSERRLKLSSLTTLQEASSKAAVLSAEMEALETQKSDLPREWAGKEDQYRDQVLHDVAPHLKSGGQILVGTQLSDFGHWVKLVALDSSGVSYMDPYIYPGKSSKLTWKDAMKQGLFKHYVVLSK